MRSSLMEIKINEQTYQVKTIRKKVKRTFLKITSNKEIIITSPHKLKESDVSEIIQKCNSWISKRLAKLSTLTLQADEMLLFGDIMKICVDERLNSAYYIKDNIIYHHQGLVKLYNDSLQKITDLFNDISRSYKLKVTPILVFRKMKSRWGVCHYGSGKIVLNKVLIHLPMEIVKYVIFHEFTHFFVPNHSKAFYALLETRVPNNRDLKKALKNYQFLL